MAKKLRSRRANPPAPAARHRRASYYFYSRSPCLAWSSFETAVGDYEMMPVAAPHAAVSGVLAETSAEHLDLGQSYISVTARCWTIDAAECLGSTPAGALRENRPSGRAPKPLQGLGSYSPSLILGQSWPRDRARY